MTWANTRSSALEKADIAETVAAKPDGLKKNLRAYENRVETRRKRNVRPSSDPAEAPIIKVVRRPENPVKLRAMERARQLGKSMTQVYKDAGVNHGYLSEWPKTGWREDRLRAVARALDWQFHELVHGTAETAHIRRNPDDLLEDAIRLATDTMRDAGLSGLPSDQVARLTRKFYEVLRDYAGSGEQLPSQAALLIWGRSLISLIMDLSKARETC